MVREERETCLLTRIALHAFRLSSDFPQPYLSPQGKSNPVPCMIHASPYSTLTLPPLPFEPL
jgi:hypothetical protein